MSSPIRSLRRFIDAVVTGSPEHGAFGRGFRGEYVPHPLMALDEIVALLRESRRDHHGYDLDGDICEKINYLDGEHTCTCGMDAWNAKVDAALKEAK